MLEFYAHIFIMRATKLTAWEKTAGEGKPDEGAVPERTARLYADLNIFGTLCAQAGLTSAAQQCQRIAKNLEQNRMQVTCGYIREALTSLRERTEDGLQSHKFFALSEIETKLFNKPDQGWEDVIGRFPRVRHDVEESTKCFALGRYAAALFHVLLVAELGVIEISRFFGVEGDKPGWSCLGRLQQVRDKKRSEQTPHQQKHSKLLDNVLPLAIAMKDSWRHRISHVDNKLDWLDTDFSREVAEEIISATRGFMRRLANDMPNSP